MSKKITFLIIALLFFSGCGQWNIFKWAHKEGGSTDATALVSDGQSALNRKDYIKAKEFFAKALQANPNSSEANYGYAQAIIGASGLGLAQIISSVIQQAKSPGVPLPAGNPFIHFVSNSFSASQSDLLPSTLDLAKLYAVSKDAVPPLKKIADAQCDGIIPANDVDVNINLAFLLVVRAGCRVLDTNTNGNPGDSGDVVKIDNTFDVKYPSTKPSDYTTDIVNKLKEQLTLAIDDAVSAVHYLTVALETIQPEAAKDLKQNSEKLKTQIEEFKNTVNTW